MPAMSNPTIEIKEGVDPRRSAMMGRVRGKDTAPELVVRRLLFAAGYRYRLHAKELPGKPDVVFRKQRKAIFVHGCFWHRHAACRRATMPKTRTGFWLGKFVRTQVRDQENEAALLQLGWDVLIVWECETKDLGLLSRRLRDFLRFPNRVP